MAPGWPIMPWFWGRSGYVKPNPIVPAQPADPAFQSDPSQEFVKSEFSCLAPIASALMEQGFSEAVAARIKAPQRISTRSV